MVEYPPTILAQTVLIDATYPEGFNDLPTIDSFMTELVGSLGGVVSDDEFIYVDRMEGWTLAGIFETGRVAVTTWEEHNHVQVDISVSKEFDPEDIVRWMKKLGFNKGYYTLLYRGPEAPIKDLVCDFEDVD